MAAVTRDFFSIHSIADCVEQLIRNSMNAGSMDIAIRVNLEKYTVQVVDNGNGLDKTQMANLAAEYMHDAASGSLSGILRLASHILVESRHKNDHDTWRVVLRRSSIGQIEASAENRPSVGTTVTVFGLFSYNAVRRQALNSNVELNRLIDLVTAIALFQPNISFSFRTDPAGNMVVVTHRTGSISTTFSRLFGATYPHPLHTLEFTLNYYHVLFYVGMVGHRNSSLQYVYLNRRPVFRTVIHTVVSNMLSLGSGGDVFGVFAISLDCPSQEAEALTDSLDTDGQCSGVLNFVQSSLANWLHSQGLAVPRLTRKRPVNVPAAEQDRLLQSITFSVDGLQEACKNAVNICDMAIRSQPATKMSKITRTDEENCAESIKFTRISLCMQENPYRKQGIVFYPWCGEKCFDSEAFPLPESLLEAKCDRKTIGSPLQPTVKQFEIKEDQSENYYEERSRSANTVLTELQLTNEEESQHSGERLSSFHELLGTPVWSRDEFEGTDCETVPTPTVSKPRTRTFIFATAQTATAMPDVSVTARKAQTDYASLSWHNNADRQAVGTVASPSIMPIAGLPDALTTGGRRLKNFAGLVSPYFRHSRKLLHRRSVTFAPRVRQDRLFTLGCVDSSAEVDALAAVGGRRLLASWSSSHGDLMLRRDVLPECVLRETFAEVRFSRAMLSDIQFIGQVDSKLLACVINDSDGTLLVLIDQHAADERRRLEQIYRTNSASEGLVASQSLPRAVELPLPPTELSLVRLYQRQLEQLGCNVLSIDHERVSFSALPTWLLEDSARAATDFTAVMQESLKNFIHDALKALKDSQGVVATLPKFLDDRYKTTACKGAVKFGQKLSSLACVRIVENLKRCEFPFQCAHGRPSVVPVVKLLPDTSSVPVKK